MERVLILFSGFIIGCTITKLCSNKNTPLKEGDVEVMFDVDSEQKETETDTGTHLASEL